MADPRQRGPQTLDPWLDPSSEATARSAERRADEARSEVPQTEASREAGRRTGPLESLFQEAVRRATTLGLSGFFLTEEAVRRALTEAVPKEWVDYLSRQSEDVRREAMEGLVREFGHWLRGLDVKALLGQLLEEYDLTATIQLSASPKSQNSTHALKSVPRPR